MRKSFGVRAIAVAGLLALVIPGGSAVGFHSGTNKHPFRTLVAPFDSSDHQTYSYCGILGNTSTASCTADSSADHATGIMTAQAAMSSALPVSTGGYADGYATIRATDSLRRTGRRGYTVTVHVDRVDIEYGADYPWGFLQVQAAASGCECSRYAYADLYDPGQAGKDLTFFLDFAALSPGTVTISVDLIADVYSPTGNVALSTSGRSTSLDLGVTLTKIDVFR